MTRERLTRAGQGHLADALDALEGADRERLAAQIDAIDVDLIGRLVERMDDPEVTGDGTLEPPDVVALDDAPPGSDADAAAIAAGEAMLRDGRVAAVLVAGGQGTRLGFDGPKGDYPFAPVTGRTLFAQHAGRIAAMRRRYGAELPWYIMTSPQNDAATREILEREDRFGLPPDSVATFVQGEMPAVDRATGRILMEAPDRIALSPDGHGGLFAALDRAGILDRMAERGITTFVTFNVDNPLLRVAHPRLLGLHAQAGSQMSNIVVRKTEPGERVGIVAKRDGRTVLVEYSDLPDEVAAERDTDGALRFWAGSIAAHAIEREFAERVARQGDGLPFHRAIKAVPHIDDSGAFIRPDEPNAVKFESFIFDALPMAERTLSVESRREEEFSPIKNAEGSDSPETTRRDLRRLYGSWLRHAGVDLPVDDDGDPGVDIEIDPRFALDENELAERLDVASVATDGPIVIGPDGPEAQTGTGGRTAPE